MNEKTTEATQPAEDSKQPSYVAYSVEDGKDDKSHWQRIGAAWPAKGDGLNLKLNAIPVDGRVVLRPREELDRMRAEREPSPEKQPDMGQP